MRQFWNSCLHVLWHFLSFLIEKPYDDVLFDSDHAAHVKLSAHYCDVVKDCPLFVVVIFIINYSAYRDKQGTTKGTILNHNTVRRGQRQLQARTILGFRKELIASYLFL